MNESDVQRTLDRILAREGVHSNDPADHGGDTWYGVTLPFALQWHIPWPPTEDEARAGYRTMLAATRVDRIPDWAVFDLVADCAVNDGTAGIRWLQRAIGVTSDGVIGPKTVAAMAAVSSWRAAYVAVLKARFRFYASIVQGNLSQAGFLGGWINRACEFVN